MSQFLIVQYQIYIETTNQIQKQLIIKTYVINFYFIHDYNSNYQSKLIIINFHVSKKIQNQKKKISIRNIFIININLISLTNLSINEYSHLISNIYETYQKYQTSSLSYDIK